MIALLELIKAIAIDLLSSKIVGLLPESSPIVSTVIALAVYWAMSSITDREK